MSVEHQPSATVATETSHTTTEPLEKELSGPKEEHERPVSHSSRDSEDVDLEKQGPDDGTSPMERSQSESSTVYPGPKEAAIVMLALILAIFLVALDRTIIATAIPKITDDFNSLDDVGWYGSAFLLTSCCFQLLFGRVYTFYTPKHVFLILIGLFEIGSAICGAAPNSIAFIFGRAIAGVGTAGIMSGAVVLMVAAVPLAKRPMYQGFFGAVFGLASVAGPLLGGVFTTDVSWRWCFYINLPIGGIAMLIIMFILKPTEPLQKGLSVRQQLAKLDLLGELFLLPSIVCLLLGLQWGGAKYPWSDGRVIALFVVFGVLFIAFVAVQVLRPETATIPASIINNRSIIGSMWFTFCLASTMMLLVYYVPIWFQAIRGTSAVQSGIDTIPMVLSLVLGAILGGQGTGRSGYYTPFMLASGVIMPIGTGLISMFDLNTSEPKWIGYQILFGFGLGLGMQQGSVAAQTVLHKKDVPTGVSLMFFAQMLGGAVFISVGQNVLDSHLVANLSKLIHNLSPAMIVNTGATDLRSIVPAKDLHEVLVAYNSALRQTFYVAVATACIAILGAVFVEWRSVKGKQGPLEKKKASEAKTDEAGDAVVAAS